MNNHLGIRCTSSMDRAAAGEGKGKDTGKKGLTSFPFGFQQFLVEFQDVIEVGITVGFFELQFSVVLGIESDQLDVFAVLFISGSSRRHFW